MRTDGRTDPLKVIKMADIGTAIGIFGLTGMFFIGIMLFLIVFYILSIGLTIWMILDCNKREKFHAIQGPNARIIWMVILVASFFFSPIPLLGVIAYYFLEKSKDKEQMHQPNTAFSR